MSSYSIPTWEGIRYTKKVTGQMDGGCIAASAKKTELSYVTLNSAPDMLYFACRPRESHRTDVTLAYDAGLDDWNREF